VIKLSKIQLDQIIYEATTSYPSECCGLLVGNTSDHFHIINNIVTSTNVLRILGNYCFEIDPQDRINLERKLRGTTDNVIGHFHSHPNSSNTPSKIDLEMAYEPEMIWLIVSVIEGKFHDFATYRLDKAKQQYIELSCEIIN
jgi:proteasome lid subunit RPN8/RPN11